MHARLGPPYEITIHAFPSECRKGGGAQRPPSRSWDDNDGHGYALAPVVSQAQAIISREPCHHCAPRRLVVAPPVRCSSTSARRQKEASAMPCCQGQDYDRMFDARRARKDLRAYNRRGARGATRRLLDAVRESMRETGTAQFTHLDIGGGVGVLQHELARDGAVHTTAVDA